MVERRDAHVRAQGNRGMQGHLGHAFDPVGRVLEVLEVDIMQFFGHANRSFDRPGRVRVDAQPGARAESLAHELDRGHFDVGF